MCIRDRYLAEQNQDLRLTGDAMKLVLEDFMAQMKELKDQDVYKRQDLKSEQRMNPYYFFFEDYHNHPSILYFK